MVKSRALNKRARVWSVRFFKTLSNVISLLFFAGVLFSVAWFLWTSYQYYFVPRFDPFSIKLESSSLIEMKGRDDCDLFQNFNSTNVPYPLKYFNNSNSDVSFSSVKKDLDFLFVGSMVGDGSFTVVKYTETGEREEVQTDAPFIKGKAANIRVQLDRNNELHPAYYLCAPEFLLDNDSLNYLVPSDPDLQKSAYITVFGPFSISLWEPRELQGLTFSNAAHMSVSVSGGFSRIEIYVKGTDLQPPFTLNRLSDKFSIESYSTRILDPKGELKYGNRELIKLGSITTFGEDSVIIPESSFHYQGRDFPISHTIESVDDQTGLLEIHGPTNSLLLNDVDLGRAAWYDLPDYVQAGIFGLILSLLTGLWTIRQSLWKWVKRMVPFIFKSDAPSKGSAVCVMSSGMVFAGKLIHEPTKEEPYFLMKDARRKLKPTDEWEKESISEIRLRAASVEQFYTL